MDAQVELTSGRLLFRYALGGAALAGQWLGAALRAASELPGPVSGDGGLPEPRPPAPRAALVGALSSALRWRPASAPLEKASRHAGRATRMGLRLLSHAPGAGLVEKRVRDLRAELASHVERWVEEGAREELAGRRLVRLATPAFVELAMARLAESPELRTLIEEQSEGLATASVAELRERSERADQVVERIVRRLLHPLKQSAPDVGARPAR